MNLAISKETETKFNTLAKQNKLVSNNKDKVLPWFLFFEIKNEEVVLVREFPAPDADKKPEVDHKNWETEVWEPVVDIIAKDYKSTPCMVAVDVLFTTKDKTEKGEPVFFKWCPDTGVKVKDKMMIGASFQKTKQKLDVQGKTPEISQVSQLDFKHFASVEAQLRGFDDGKE